MAKEFRRGSKVDGFTNFSATPPLELVKLIISLVATAQRDRATQFGQGEHENNSCNRDDVTGPQQSVFSRSSQRRDGAEDVMSMDY